jgi:bacterioferritin-associated ferredoxin
VVLSRTTRRPRKDARDFVCFCQGISRQEIVQCIHDGAHTLEAIQNGCGATAGACGGSCTPNVAKLIHETIGAQGGTCAAGEADGDGRTPPSGEAAGENRPEAASGASAATADARGADDVARADPGAAAQTGRAGSGR